MNVVGTQLNCLDKSRQFNWVQTTYACFYKESQKNIALVSLDTPLMKFFADLSLTSTHIRGIFYYKFFSDFLKNLSVQCGN